MSISEVIAPLLGRIAIGWYLVNETWKYAVDWDGTIAMLDSLHITAPPVLFGLFLFMVALTSLALILGYYTRQAAMALFAAMLGITVLLHHFWDMQGAARNVAFDLFSRDVVLMGALLLLVGMGAGRFAADNSGKKKGGH